MKNPFKVIQHFIRLYAGLVAAAQKESDTNAVSYIVENVIENYEKEYTKAVEEHNEQVNRDDNNDDNDKNKNLKNHNHK